MKRYMSIKEYCEETGFPVKKMRRLCDSDKAHKFCDQKGEKGKILITVPIFEAMWDRGELRG